MTNQTQTIDPAIRELNYKIAGLFPDARTNRFRDAVDAQAGACNPIALSKALHRAIMQVHEEQPKGGHQAIIDDSAVFLILHQLVYVLTGTDCADNFQRWSKAHDECQAKDPTPTRSAT